MNFEKLYEKIKNGRYNKANYQLVVICHLSLVTDLWSLVTVYIRLAMKRLPGKPV